MPHGQWHSQHVAMADGTGQAPATQRRGRRDRQQTGAHHLGRAHQGPALEPQCMAGHRMTGL
jgi:hypothetical protein